MTIHFHFNNTQTRDQQKLLQRKKEKKKKKQINLPKATQKKTQPKQKLLNVKRLANILIVQSWLQPLQLLCSSPPKTYPKCIQHFLFKTSRPIYNFIRDNDWLSSSSSNNNGTEPKSITKIRLQKFIAIQLNLL